MNVANLKSRSPGLKQPVLLFREMQLCSRKPKIPIAGTETIFEGTEFFFD